MSPQKILGKENLEIIDFSMKTLPYIHFRRTYTVYVRYVNKMLSTIIFGVNTNFEGVMNPVVAPLFNRLYIFAILLAVA